MNAMIQLPYDNFRALENDLARLRRENAALRRESSGHRVAPDEAISSAAFAAALEIVRFAVANLEPRTVRGWPHHELAVVAELLPKALPAIEEVGVLANTLREFAREAADIDRERQRRVEAARVTLGLTDEE
jgi:hypothetical protein